MPSRIEVLPAASGFVKLHLRLDSYDADVSAEMRSSDIRILATRLIKAADIADRQHSVGSLIESLR